MEKTTESRKKKFVKDIGVYAIGNLGSKLITFLMVPLYTHYISDTSNFGYYDICLNVVLLFVPFITLQLRDGAFRFLIGAEEPERKRLVVSFVYKTLLMSVVLAVFLTLIASALFTIRYIWYVFGLLCAMSVYEVVTQVSRGLGSTKTFVAAGILTSFGVGIFSVVFVVILGWDVEGIFMANILARLVSLVFIDLKLNIIKNYFDVKACDWGLNKKILSYSLPLMSGTLCWWLTSSSDRFFIEHYLGLDCNGIYAVAVRFTAILQTLAMIFYQAWQETALKQYNSADRDSFFSNMLNGYIFALAAVLLLYAFGLKLNYYWLVDREYQESVAYIYVMGISALLYALAAFMDLGYQCASDTVRTLPAVVLSAVVNVVFNFLLIQKFNIYGVIATSVLTYVVLLVYRLFDMRRYFRLRFYSSTLVPILIVIIGAVPFYFSESAIFDVAFVLVGILVICFALPEQYKNMLFSRLRKKA